MPDRSPVAILQAGFDRVSVELEIAVAHAARGEQLLAFRQRSCALSTVVRQARHHAEQHRPAIRHAGLASEMQCILGHLQRLRRILRDHRLCEHAHAFRFEAPRSELLRELHCLPCVTAAVIEVRLHQQGARHRQVHEQLAAQVADAPREIEPFAATLAAPGRLAAILVRDREHRQIRQEHADETVIARFLDALGEVLARRHYPAALVVRIAESAQGSRDLDVRLRLHGKAVRLLVCLHARIQPAEREAQIPAQRVNAGARFQVRGAAQRAFGMFQRFQGFFVAIHDAQRRGDADPGAAMAVLIDREVERLAIRGQRVMRATELQQQLAEQQAALVQQDRFACQRARLVDESQCSLESQRGLLRDRRFEIGGRGAIVVGCREMIRA